VQAILHNIALSALPKEIPDYRPENLHKSPQINCMTLYILDNDVHPTPASFSEQSLEEVREWHQLALDTQPSNPTPLQSRLPKKVLSNISQAMKGNLSAIIELNSEINRMLEWYRFVQTGPQNFFLFSQFDRVYRDGPEIHYRSIDDKATGFNTSFASNGFYDSADEQVYVRGLALAYNTSLKHALLDTDARVWTPSEKRATESGLEQDLELAMVLFHELGESRKREYCVKKGMDPEPFETEPLLGELLAQRIAWKEMKAAGRKDLIDYSKAHFAHAKLGENERSVSNAFYQALKSNDPAGFLDRLIKQKLQEYKRFLSSI
jgi:hypothetical protein